MNWRDEAFLQPEMPFPACLAARNVSFFYSAIRLSIYRWRSLPTPGRKTVPQTWSKVAHGSEQCIRNQMPALRHFSQSCEVSSSNSIYTVASNAFSADSELLSFQPFSEARSMFVRLTRGLSDKLSIVCRTALALFLCFTLSTLLAPVAGAQDAVGTLEGIVSDSNGRPIVGATLTLQNLETNSVRTQTSNEEGRYRFTPLSVGRYSLATEAAGFAHFTQSPIEITVSQTTQLNIALVLATVQQAITVVGSAPPVDTTTNTLGKVVSSKEVLDLPLNGRNFAQLGLLQAGVAPLSAGLITEGGSLRSGQSYAVNGQRPEANNFLLDGAQNVNRMDGGFALKIPIDAIAEFRILTNTAPPEYGANTGSTTSVVTRAGGNEFHGTIYEFLRNDALDTRNYFSSEVEPLKQNQFGATIGGPIRTDKLFFFAYYEGFRNHQGITTSATVPTTAEKKWRLLGSRLSAD
jgi:hypothetical protein